MSVRSSRPDRTDPFGSVEILYFTRSHPKQLVVEKCLLSRGALYIKSLAYHAPVLLIFVSQFYLVKEPSRVDDLFEALSNPYRRQLLVALLEHNPQDDYDRDPLDLVSDDIEPDVLELHLFHSHLPKLEEMDFITWDRETNEISKGPDWDEIKPLLTLIDSHQDELPDGWL